MTTDSGTIRTRAPQRALGMMREFLQLESAGGIILMFAAVAALLLSNSPLAAYYFSLLDTPVVVQVGALALDKPLLLWVNDGLMAIFFLLVGLEIKREILEGELSSRDRATLPAIAAVGGMAVPAVIYIALNLGDSQALGGWAIPAATDIAFALGVLSLLGTRVPVSLKVFLLALAIIDDLGAIVIIAIFYTADLSLVSLALAALALLGLLALNLRGVSRIAPYVLLGIVLWVCVLKSGVHATLAGVALGLAIPLHTPDGRQDPLERLEHMLLPWVAFAIMPAFAFANAGVPLGGLTFADLLAPVPLGIALGLFLGKQLGIFGFAWVAVKTGIGRLPDGASWAGFWGVSLLAGIGFTMSLFIGTLAFNDPAHAAQVRLGVLGGSLLSGVIGYLVLRALLKERPDAEQGTATRQTAG